MRTVWIIFLFYKISQLAIFAVIYIQQSTANGHPTSGEILSKVTVLLNDYLPSWSHRYVDIAVAFVAIAVAFHLDVVVVVVVVF